MLHVLDIALRGLWQRRMRTVLTIVAIAVCTMLFLVMSTSSAGLDRMYGDSAAGFRGRMFVSARTDRPTGGSEFPPVSSSLTDELAAAVLATDGIDAARSTPLLITPLAASLFTGGPPAVIAVGVLPGREGTFYGDATIAAGSGAVRADDGVVLGTSAAAMHGASVPGDSLTLQGHRLTVAGIAAPSGSIPIDGMVLMPLETARTIFGRSGVTTVLVAARSSDEVEAVAARLRDRFPGLAVMTEADMRATLAGSSTIVHTFTNVFGLTVLIVAGVVTLMVMLMSVGERTREFGMLRAIGARRRTILLMVLEEAVIVCLLGSAIGIPLAYVMTSVVFEGWVSASPIAIAQAAVYVTVIGVIAGLLPAYRSARIEPLEAIRYE